MNSVMPLRRLNNPRLRLRLRAGRAPSGCFRPSSFTSLHSPTDKRRHAAKQGERHMPAGVLLGPCAFCKAALQAITFSCRIVLADCQGQAAGVRSPGGDRQAGREQRREEALQGAADAGGALGVLGAHVPLAVPARRGVASLADVRHAHPVMRRCRCLPHARNSSRKSTCPRGLPCHEHAPAHVPLGCRTHVKPQSALSF